MKNRMVKMIMATMTTVLLVGCNSITVRGQQDSIKANNMGSMLGNIVSSITDNITVSNEVMKQWQQDIACMDGIIQRYTSLVHKRIMTQ